MTPKELKLWKKYRESIDKLNSKIMEYNQQKRTEYFENLNKSNLLLGAGIKPPEYKSYIEPSIVGFYDFISGYTKKEDKK